VSPQGNYVVAGGDGLCSGQSKTGAVRSKVDESESRKVEKSSGSSAAPGSGHSTKESPYKLLAGARSVVTAGLGRLHLAVWT
jgi:hypothetical protein